MSLLAKVRHWIPFSTLDRYLVRQLLLNITIAVLVLSVVLVLGQVLRVLYSSILNDQLPLDKLPGLFWNIFANSLSYTLPWGILTGVLLLFGRLSADNELTAMRMAGRNLFRIALPVLLLAAVLSGFCFWINTKVAPAAYKETRIQKYALALEDPAKLFVADEVITDIPSYVIFAKSKEGETLKHFLAFNFDEEFTPPDLGAVQLAREAVLTPSLETKSIDLKARNFYALTYEFERFDAAGKKITAEQAAQQKGTATSELVLKAPHYQRLFDASMDLSRFFQKATRPRVAGMTMSELKQVYTALASKDPSLAAVKDQQMREYITKMPPKEQRQLKIESLTTYNNRYSFSLACFVLAFCGISFGITAQRRETSSGFVMSLVVGMLYFALIMLAEIWKNRPEMRPELWVWLPNVVFGLVGLILFLRHSRR